MTLYLHAVPGRLRLRSRHQLGHKEKLERLVSCLATLDGVTAVRPNRKAASAVITYDPDRHDSDSLLQHLVAHGVLDTCLPQALTPAKSSASPPLFPDAAAGAARLGGMFGKALFDALLHKSVERSITLLVGGRR